jgi:hypothetical protein
VGILQILACARGVIRCQRPSHFARLSDDELACPPIEDLAASSGPERLLVAALATKAAAAVRALRPFTHLEKKPPGR